MPVINDYEAMHGRYRFRLYIVRPNVNEFTGGEAQRIKLAKCLGAKTKGKNYIF